MPKPFLKNFEAFGNMPKLSQKNFEAFGNMPKPSQKNFKAFGNMPKPSLRNFKAFGILPKALSDVETVMNYKTIHIKVIILINQYNRYSPRKNRAKILAGLFVKDLCDTIRFI
jgi:hypothetical protein